MKSMFFAGIAAWILFAGLAGADVRDCACDPARPGGLEGRECSLCGEAEKHDKHSPVFFLKDINPRKPNRWLALPRIHTAGPHSLASLPPDIRTQLWTAAIEKARSLWGENWGLAVNSDESRTQCHAHVHIGKLLDEAESSRAAESRGVAIVKDPAEIQLPAEGGGFWIHPVGDRLHVHQDIPITETVLLR